MSEDDDLPEELEEESPHGLNLDRMLVVDDEKVLKARERIEGLLRQVEEDLEKRGIPEAPKPKNHPEPLADFDISLLTNAQVASLYAQYVAYSSYIGNELAKIEGMEEAAKKHLRDTLAELKDAGFVKGLKGPEATAAALKDELYRALDLEHMKLFFMKAIMKRRYKGYVSQAAALSRTIELRKLDFEQTRRDDNIGKRPAVPRSFGSPGAKRK